MAEPPKGCSSQAAMEVGGVGFKVAVKRCEDGDGRGDEIGAHSRGVNQERGWEMGATWRPEGSFGQIMKYCLAFDFCQLAKLSLSNNIGLQQLHCGWRAGPKTAMKVMVLMLLFHNQLASLLAVFRVRAVGSVAIYSSPEVGLRVLCEGCAVR